MHQRVAGIDVHRMKHVVTILIGREDGAVSSETREFGGFKRDMRALVAWLQTHRIQQVVMESTGIYWKSVFAHLEAAGIPALVVNAFHVKTVPGRKTDVGDSEWLAQLATAARELHSTQGLATQGLARTAHRLTLPTQADRDAGRGKEPLAQAPGRRRDQARRGCRRYRRRMRLKKCSKA
jgi:transposase